MFDDLLVVFALIFLISIFLIAYRILFNTLASASKFLAYKLS
jgi:hypothetical protein